MSGMSSRSMIAALGSLLVAGLLASSPIMRRLMRNTTLPGIPDPVAPAYPPCSDAELIGAVSLVVTVKDTCAQAEELLTHLSTMFPKDIPVFYAFPAIRGCRHVKTAEIGGRFFSNFTQVSVGANEAPIAGFLKVQPLLKTKYAVLMHNDAYPLEGQFACEMYRALEAHPQYPIAAPQIYEAAMDKLIVPHGHHENLHVRPSSSGEGLRIDYDLSFDLMTQREPWDFREGPQPDFLEDHAFMARSDLYRDLLDPAGSFTLEYMDMILNMRARNTSAWYVPSARCVFDVDTDKITWEDLPYLIYKRSEQVGHQVRTYLTKKWGVEFVNTGIWNYVRYFMIADVVLEGAGLPDEWKDQAAIFFTWFESVGFNRYDGEYLPDFVEEPPRGGKTVKVSRSLEQTLPTDVPENRVPPRSAQEILPRQQRKKLGSIDLSFKEPNMPIGVRMTTCDASDPRSYSGCGMAVQDGDDCTCWSQVVSFNIKTTLYLDKLMAWMKLPSRALLYGQMKYWTVPIDPRSVEVFCDRRQADCSYDVRFSEKARILQWSWFGKQQKGAFTPEGLAIGASLLFLSLALLARPSLGLLRLFGLKDSQARNIAALNQAVCSHSVRS